MFRHCCVPKCETQRQDAKFHRFPVRKENRDQWLRNIGSEELLRMDNIVNKAFVCHKHFEKRFVTSSDRLKIGAVPTLFTEFEINTGNPGTSSTLENKIPTTNLTYCLNQHQHDHTYCARLEDVTTVILGMDNIQPTTSAVTVKVESGTAVTSDIATPVATEKTTIMTTENTGSLGLNVLGSCPKRPKRKRTIRCIQQLTPKCRKLYSEYRKARKQLSFTHRSKKALKFSKEKSFEDVVSGMNPLAQKLFWMQVKLCTKKVNARRFTLNEKLIALSILKQGPKCYRFLQRIFLLPSENTLRRLVSRLQIGAGINFQIFEAIKNEVSMWKEQKKYCTIIFDEMAVEPNLCYTAKDEILGFIDENNDQFADHVLVFMLKGVVHKWQQPIAYYFCEGSTPGVTLKAILRDVVRAVGNTGLLPLSLVSDQGASFQSALHNLKEETRRIQIFENKAVDDTIQLAGFNLNVIYDPCHLIKGLRNNFLVKNISFDGKIAKWSDIVDVYKTDCQHTQSRLLHKLNDEHVIPEKIKKMKVKNCVRVFSKTMAGALNFTSAFSHYSDGRPVSSSLENTAEVVSFFDDLFDSVNGAAVFNRKKRGKQLSSAVTANSTHHAFWQEAILKLNRLKFVDQNGREKTVPSIKNWISTLQSMQRLWQVLSRKNIKIMRPRYLNSDAIENFFGQVRSYNIRDNNPTCHNFVATFKSLLITGFIKFHHTSFNCENDDGNQLLKIRSLFKYQRDKKISSIDSTQTSICGEIDRSFVNTYYITQEARRERLIVQSRAYTAGWVIRKILSKSYCENCKKNLTVDETTDIHKWINYREYKEMSQKKLTYPAEHIVRYFGMIFEETNLYLEHMGNKSKLSKNIIGIIKTKVNFEHITCQVHRDEVIHVLLSIVVKLCIHNWCTVINKILKGTDIVRLENRVLPRMQQKAFDKYKKKLKKKNK